MWLPDRNTLQHVLIGLQIPDRNGKSYLFFLVGENLYAARIHFFLDFLVTCRNSKKQ